jgi:ZIP family zinc transporter
VLEAGWWGFFGASSLVLGAMLVMIRRPGPRVLGLVMGFGAGVLLSAVSFELVEVAVDTAHGTGATGLGLGAGAITFFLGDAALARIGDGRGPDASRGTSEGMPIVLGTILDGVPESAVLGLTLLETGSIGLSMLVTVFVSNELAGRPIGLVVTLGYAVAFAISYYGD